MNEARAEAVYAYIEAHPGRNACQVARALGMTDGAVRNALAATEKLGLYLYEEKGKLHIWETENENMQNHQREKLRR